MENSNGKNGKPNFYELYRTVGRIEAGVKGAKDELEKLRGIVAIYCRDNDKRVGDVEKKAANLSGQAKVVGGVTGFIMGAIAVAISIFKN